jgi:hypothetical protein
MKHAALIKAKRFPFGRFWDGLVRYWEFKVAAFRDLLQELIGPELSLPRRRRFIPEFEQLEIRWLPSSSITLALYNVSPFPK